MSYNKITIAILNYNGRQHLESYLSSVVEYSKDATIVVIDNASTDDSVSFLAQNYPSVKLIINKENHGFADGYNTGLKEINSEYVLLLNSDVRVTSDWVKPLKEILDTNPKTISVQPKILADKAQDNFEYAGACGGYIDYLGYPFCRGRIFDHLEQDHSQYDTQKQVSWTSGAAMLVRTKVFKELGGFDADYFAHMEEIDFCIRAQRAGYSLYVEPKSVVYHLGGGTLNYQSPRKTYLNFRNNLLTIFKNEKTSTLLWLILTRLILDGVAGVKFVLDGKFQHCIEIIKAHFAFYGHLPKAMKKRRMFNSKYPKTTGQWLKHSKPIIKEYFLEGKKKYSNL